MPVTALPKRSDVRPVDRRDLDTAERLLVAASMLIGLDRRDAETYATTAITMLIAFREHRSST